MKIEYFKKNHPISTKILLSGINKERISHAFLFVGTTYFSKLAFAKLYAKIILCENKIDNEVCNVCESCILINEDKYFDIHIIDEEMNIKTEKIDEALSLISKKSFYNKKRFLIINNAEKMTKSAYNKLLIFLENPNDDVIIILITNNIYAIDKTIISRCQSIPFVEFNENKEVSEVVNFFVNCTIEEGLMYLNENKLFLKEKKELLTFLDELVIGIEIKMKSKINDDFEVSKEINYLHEVKIAKNKLIANTTAYTTIESLLIKAKGENYGISRS